MPCGYDAARSYEEAIEFSDRLALPRSARAASSPSTRAASFSRPGPRLVDGLEVLAQALHPDRVPEAPGKALELVLE